CLLPSPSPIRCPLIPPLFPSPTLFRSVLAGARLGDHALLLHARGEQGLAQHVVDLVCARMAEVLALEPDARPATVLGQARREVEDRKSTRLNSSHEWISYAVFCLKKKT